LRFGVVAALALAIAPLGACRILGIAALPCDRASECPPGDQCTNHVCTGASGEGEGASSEGEGTPCASPAPVDPSVCDGPPVVADDFTDAALPNWIPGGGGAISAGNGALTLGGASPLLFHRFPFLLPTTRSTVADEPVRLDSHRRRPTLVRRERHQHPPGVALAP